MPQPTKPQRPRDPDDDELEPLPPLEGDDEPFDGAPEDELDESPDDAADDAYDDREAGDLVAPEGVDQPDEAPAEADDDRGIEIDDHGLGDDAFSLSGDDAETPGVGDEDFGLGDGLGEAGDDRGEEGFDDEGDSLDDEESLPDLDGEDDDDELDWAAEAALLGRRASPLPPWQDASWARQSPRSPDGPADDVACESGKVLAAGTTLLSVAPGAAQPQASPDAGAVTRVALEPLSPHRALALTAAGALVVIDEQGASPLASPGPPARLCWARSPFVALASGQLFEHRGGSWVEVVPRGTIALASGPMGSLAALVRAGDRLSLRHSTDGGASFRAREVAAPDGDAHGPAHLATTEAASAIALPGVLLLSRRGGPFLAVDGCAGAVALAFAGQGPDAPLLALLARDEAGPLHLAHVDADGRATLLAELPAHAPGHESDDDEGGGLPRAALAWDESRGVVWVASPAGLAAYGPARR